MGFAIELLRSLEWSERLRAKVKAVAAAAREGAFVVESDGGVVVAGERLAPHEVSWRRHARDGHVVAVQEPFVVMLEVTVDEALAREGLARELNRVVQDLRKRARLAYDTHVELAVVGPLDDVLRDHGPWLCEQAGATLLVRHRLGVAMSARLDVDGASVTVELAPIVC